VDNFESTNNQKLTEERMDYINGVIESLVLVFLAEIGSGTFLIVAHLALNTS